MSDSSEWVSLRQAADLLGVHPATVRNWADRGDLVSRRTPGGHRRFRRSDLVNYAAAQGEIQPLEVQLIIQNALGKTRMEVSAQMLTSEPWYTSMSPSTRDEMRHQGRLVLEGLRDFMAHGAPDEMLAGAIRLGRNYAAILHADGMTLPNAVRGFFYFSDFVIDSVLNWSEISVPRSTSEWTNLLRQVNTFIHSMLLSVIEYYQED